MADLTFAGQDIRSRTAIFLDLIEGYTDGVSVRGRDSIVPQTAGRISRIRMADTRTIRLAGYVTGTTRGDTASWRTATDLLMGVMDPGNDAAALVITTPYLGLSGGSVSINARCVGMAHGEPMYGIAFQTWEFVLESVDPFWA